MIKCPQCASTQCHLSAWRDDAEKRAHPRLQVFRCHSCLHRFYQRGDGVLGKLRDNPVVATVGGSTLLVVLVVTVVMVFWGGREQLGPDRWRSPDNPRVSLPAVNAETHALPRGRPFAKPDADTQRDD